MKRQFQVLLLLLLALLLAAGLPSFAAETSVARDPNLKVDPRLVNMTDEFGFQLYNKLAAKRNNDGGNIFISPISIELALAMTYNGAAGATRKAMAATLRLQGMTDEEFNQANGKLLALLQHPDSGVTISIANALWGQQGVTFNPGFLQKNITNYQADIRNLDFTTPAPAAKAINQWVSDKTQKMIPRLVTEDNIRNALLVLTNALYFKGQWTEKFDPAKTKDGPFFNVTDGTKEMLPMMHKTADLDYLETDKFQAISLPFGKKNLRLDILLPIPGATLAACAASVSSTKWTEWMKLFSAKKVALILPRFTVGYSASLKDALRALGMSTEFTTQADFSGMLTAGDAAHKPFIGDVIHKTALKVDEEGTEATAATAVVMSFTGKPQSFILFNVCHPFLIAIHDQPTGALLFWGSIAKP